MFNRNTEHSKITDGIATSAATQAEEGGVSVGLAVAAEVRKLAEQAGRLLEKMVPAINTISGLVQEITSASEEQSSGVGQISHAMNQLNQITQQNASASEELAATAEEMNEPAEQLQVTMNIFKVACLSNMELAQAFVSFGAINRLRTKIKFHQAMVLDFLFPEFKSIV